MNSPKTWRVGNMLRATLWSAILAYGANKVQAQNHPVPEAAEAPLLSVDFTEQAPIVRLGAERYLPIFVNPDVLTKDGLRQPLAAKNFLPASVANPDGKMENWKFENCRAVLSSAERITGDNSLRLSFDSEGGSVSFAAAKPDDSKLVAPFEKGYSYVFSCYLRPESSNAEITLTLSGSAKGANKQPVNTEQSSAVTLPAGRWTRAAVILDFPLAAAPEILTCKIAYKGAKGVATDGNAVVAVFIDALQLERCRNYPVFQTQPSDWMPGGSNRGAPKAVNVLAELLPLSETEGTLVLQIKPDPALPRFSSGDCAWFAIGAGWDVVAELNDNTFQLGKSRLRFPSLSATWPDEKFHQIALVWNRETLTCYRDGELISAGKRAALSEEKPFTERMRAMNILLGQASSRWRTNQGTLAYCAAYDRALLPEQLKVLDAAQTHGGKDTIRLSLPERADFTRDEIGVSLSLRLLQTNGKSNKSVSFRVRICREADEASGKDINNLAVEQESGESMRIQIPLDPQRMMPGRYLCLITRLDGESSKTYRQSFTIHPALPSSGYGLMMWGSPVDPKKWKRYQSEGAMCVDTFGYKLPSAVRDADALGITLSAHTNNFAHDSHPATPANWDRIMRCAENDAFAIARAAHRVRYALLNSEEGGRADVENSPRMLHDLKKKTGLTKPPLGDNGEKFDLASRPKLDLKKYAGNGLVPADLPGLKYLEWLVDRGNGVSPVNAGIIDILKGKTPGLKILGEPAHALVLHYGLYEGRDVVGAWCYELDLSAVQRRFSAGQAYARHYGCGFYPILGYVYSVMDKDGFQISEDQKMHDPALSPHAARARLWLALAQPAELMCIWNYEPYDTKGWQENQLCPGLYEESARTMRIINRLGPIYGPLAWKRPPLALFGSFTTQIGLGGEGWWHGYGLVIAEYGKVANAMGARYDLLMESDIRAGRLDSYAAVLAPALRYLPEDVHGKIAAWSAAGGRVVVDHSANPALQYANQQKIDGTLGKPKDGYPVCKEQGVAIRGWAREFAASQAGYSVRADSEDVLVVVKEAAAARYAVVINNRWQMRPTPNLQIRDAGVGQTTTLRLVDPAFTGGKPVFVYDAVDGKGVKITRENGTAVWDCALEPGEGRVYAIYPSELATLDAQYAGENPEGNPERIFIRVLDPHGQAVAGRQGLEVEILTPAGERHDASGIYPADNGITTVSLRLYAGAPRGKWSVFVREIASNISINKTLDVK